jgi:L,D-transpeptidase ErfK/SrfK
MVFFVPMNRRVSYLASIFVWIFLCQPAHSETFPLSNTTDSVVGELRYARARNDETLIDIAREFDLGYDQIVKANPSVNRWLPDAGAEITLPQLYILPGTVRRGLVMNIAELRLYYYPTPKKGEASEVRTYPVSIGRMDWRTPLGTTKVVAKERNPAWRPPRSIREEHARDGDPLPEVIPGGHPENPLGGFALRLGIPTYLIHGVDERKSFGIGMRVTHGCVRMYPEDISQLFEVIPVNTPVLIIDEPVKVGRLGDRVFLSVHQPLDEGEDESVPPLPDIPLDHVIKQVRAHVGADVELPLELIKSITLQGDGIPQEILREHRSPQINNITAGNRPFKAQSQDDEEYSNEAYNRAISRYLTDTPAPSRTGAPELKRRTSPSAQDSNDDSEVRRYLEERY